MHRLLLAAAAIGGLTALTAGGASAAPSAEVLHVAPAHPTVTQVEYWYNHHYWHHREYYHRHYRYW